jgi:hypothetical protein
VIYAARVTKNFQANLPSAPAQSEAVAQASNHVDVGPFCGENSDVCDRIGAQEDHGQDSLPRHICWPKNDDPDRLPIIIPGTFRSNLSLSSPKDRMIHTTGSLALLEES